MTQVVVVYVPGKAPKLPADCKPGPAFQVLNPSIESNQSFM